MDIIAELQKAFGGDAWHGSSAWQILNNVDTENAFSHFIPEAHSIAEIALHLTAWTEEVTSRLLGNDAKEPLRGDWPMPKEHNIQEWSQILFDFQTSNQELIRICQNLNPTHWEQPAKDLRNEPLGTGVTFKEMVNGLIQHHAYHAGQISLLTKF